jgi:hypothetical protein
VLRKKQDNISKITREKRAEYEAQPEEQLSGKYKALSSTPSTNNNNNKKKKNYKTNRQKQNGNSKSFPINN